MSHVKGLTLLAGGALALGFVQPVLADDPTTPMTSDEVRAIVSQMMADAETRSSLLQGGGTGGYDKHFYLADSTGNFKMNFSGFAQFRYDMNIRDKGNTFNGSATANSPGTAGVGDDFNNGFSMRRAAVQIDGNVWEPNFGYQVRLIENNSGQANFDDIFATYTFGTSGWSVKAGQFKPWFLKEQNNSEVYTLAADRSIVDAAFNQSRTQGVEVTYKADYWWAATSFTKGMRQLNTDFTAASNADYAFGGRFEYDSKGTKDEQLKDYTSQRGDSLAWNAGASVWWQQSKNDPANNSGVALDLPPNGNGDNSYLSYTVDTQWEQAGWTLFVAGVGSHTKGNVTGNADPSELDDFGLVVQGGWRFMDNDEVFARYEGLYLDGDRTAAAGNGLSPKDFNFVTVGYNHYFYGHASKFTLDCVIALNHDVQASGDGLNTPNSVVPGSAVLLPNTSLGLLGSNKGADLTVRAQWQWMF